MATITEKNAFTFNRFPPIGSEDWNYAYATAQCRALEMQMLAPGLMEDIASAGSYDAAADLLSNTEYSLPGKRVEDLESVLAQRKDWVHKFFDERIENNEISELARLPFDFANLRLGLRRKLLDKELGSDYSDDGNVPAEIFVQVLDEENYSRLPDYMQQAVEQGVLAYYEKKEVRRIDYAVDEVLYTHSLQRAMQLKSVFLEELCRMQIDLTNIRTMLRLIFRESEERENFLSGGYLEAQRLHNGVEMGFDGVASLFASSPYIELIESGISYLSEKNSFLMLEKRCDEHLLGYLKSASVLASGSQPVIAYFLRKLHEIRMVRLLLISKKNGLDKQLILDRVCSAA